MPWRHPEGSSGYIEAINGGRVHVGGACWVLLDGGQGLLPATLRERVRTGRDDLPWLGSVEWPGGSGAVVRPDQVVAPAESVVEAEIVDDSEDIYPLPSVIYWTVDGGQLVMNLGARDVREWPEIEYRVMSRSGVLSPAEMAGLWEQIKRLQELGGRLEHGHFVSFAKPDGPLRHDDEPPYDPRL